MNTYCAVLNIYHNKPEPKNPRMNKLKIASVNTKVHRKVVCNNLKYTLQLKQCPSLLTII